MALENVNPDESEPCVSFPSVQERQILCHVSIVPLSLRRFEIFDSFLTKNKWHVRLDG